MARLHLHNHANEQIEVETENTNNNNNTKNSLTHYNESKRNRTEEIHRNNKVTYIRQNAIIMT